MSVHFERIVDELVMTVVDDNDVMRDSIIVTFPIPEGVDELLDVIRTQAYGTPSL